MTAVDNLYDRKLGEKVKATWVQCEHENCLKWRKLPWHVDPELDLPAKFTCADNKWEVAKATCEAPEDDYDQRLEDVSAGNITVSPAELVVGGTFDFFNPATNKFEIGEIVSVTPSVSTMVVLFVATGAKQKCSLDPAASKVCPLHFFTKPLPVVVPDVGAGEVTAESVLGSALESKPESKPEPAQSHAQSPAPSLAPSLAPSPADVRSSIEQLRNALGPLSTAIAAEDGRAVKRMKTEENLPLHTLPNGSPAAP